MSQNDVIALDANYKNWEKERAIGLNGVKPFVYYCVEQYLKPYDLSDEEILYGITDGTLDGGVDAIYFLVNGILVREDTKLDGKADKPKVNLIIIQVQSKGGFSPLEINKQSFFAEDLLALSEPAKKFKSKYHGALIEIMRIFKEKYLTIAGNFPKIKIDYFYISKIDEQEPDANAIAASEQVKNIVTKHFSSAICEFHFENVQGLLKQAKLRPIRDKLLTWAEPPMSTAEGYVGLVKLKDYFDFLKNEHEQLADRMLEANVRGYQGEVSVNRQIRHTLTTIDGINFWLLNNGITIIASTVQTAGHLRLTLEDPQIVNGLQTSREIFNYFSALTTDTNDTRKLLVKVIVTPDSVVQDAVIKATNSQTKLPEGSLRTTDPIHHRIEDLFKQADLYYDRRKGFYKDNGKPISKIISVTELIQSIVSILLQRPDDARRRPSDYLTKDENYEKVFNENFPLSIYLQSILLMRKINFFMRSVDELDNTEKLNIKFYVAMLLVCRIAEDTKPTAEKIIQINIENIDEVTIGDSFKRVLKIYKELSKDDEKIKDFDFLKRLLTYTRKSIPQIRKG